MEKHIDIVHDFKEVSFKMINYQGQYGQNKIINNQFHINIQSHKIQEVRAKLLSHMNHFLIEQ